MDNNVQPQVLSDALADSIDRLILGQSIEDCLRMYPKVMPQLRVLLETGMAMRRAAPTEAEIAAARDRVRMRVLSHERKSEFPFVFMRSMALLAAIVLVLFIGASVYAENSLPGDTIYSLKRFTEELRVAVGGQDFAKQFTSRRVQEVVRLLMLHRAANVEFQGELQVANGTNWYVTSVAVTVDPQTPGAADVVVGDLIEVVAASTTQGTLVASKVSLVSKGASTPTPTVTLTGTSDASETPTPTATAPRGSFRTPTDDGDSGAAPTAGAASSSNSGSGNSGANSNSGSVVTSPPPAPTSRPRRPTEDHPSEEQQQPEPTEFHPTASGNHPPNDDFHNGTPDR